jgi:hypothetical protein
MLEKIKEIRGFRKKSKGQSRDTDLCGRAEGD